MRLAPADSTAVGDALGVALEDGVAEGSDDTVPLGEDDGDGVGEGDGDSSGSTGPAGRTTRITKTGDTLPSWAGRSTKRQR